MLPSTSDLPLYAFIFVVEAIVMAASRIPREELRHLVLVKIHIAGVGVGVLIVNVKLAALAAADLLFSVFRKIHSTHAKTEKRIATTATTTATAIAP